MSGSCFLKLILRAVFKNTKKKVFSKKLILIMNNIMDVHKLSINLDINRYIEYTLMYIGYECVGYKCVGYVFIYTLMYSCIKPYK